METQKIALITGISGQDGSYLAEYLLNKNYIVHGIIRRSSSINTKRLDSIYNNPLLSLHYGDLSDSSFISRIINETKPEEVYNLAAMSHVAVSFKIPEYTCDVDALGTLRLLEAIKNVKEKNIKMYQAGTSELYGGVYDKPQNEDTPFCPQSPYAVAKLFSYWITKNYRDAYNIFAVNGILFNHTSPRRGETFVEQKIVQAAVNIKKGKQESLQLGNMYSYRDFGHAKDFIHAMWLMMQQKQPDDYVISSGLKYMIKDIVNMVFSKLDMELEWSGDGKDEKGTLKNSDRVLVSINPKYFRPLEVDSLLGDSTLARSKLGWTPKYTFDDILNEMIEEEMKK